MSLEDAREKLEDWLCYYNEDRPHSGIGYIAPILLNYPGGASSLRGHLRQKTLASDDPTLGLGARCQKL